MPITFNTNLAALGAQRNIGISSNMASSSLAKLSSGSRIPTAKDDAAGLAIGSKLRSEVAGLTQASNNAAQAVSMLQIADGALSSMGDILQRMKTLAVQSSSGQLDDASRSLLNQEFTNLQSEINRVASLTNFNGTTLLNGGQVQVTQTETQAGYLDGKGIKLTFDPSVTAADAVYKVDYAYDGSGAIDVGNLTVTNLTDGSKQTINIAAAIRGVTGETDGGVANAQDLTQNLGAGKTVDINFAALGVKVTLDSRFDVDTAVGQNVPMALVGTAGSDFTATVTTAPVINTGGRITGAQLAALSTLDSVTGKVNVTLTSINGTADEVNIAAVAGLEFSTDGITWATTAANVATGTAGDGFYVRTGNTGNALAFVSTAGITSSGTAGAQTAVFSLDISGMVRGVEAADANKTFSFKVGTGTTTNDSISFTLRAATATDLGVNSVTVDTAANADLAIGAINSAITAVASRRADIGAAQSRLDFAANSISVSIENTTAATSAIMDVDVSAEITNFTNKNVLMQAGISLLGQANQQPALLLRLLQ